MLYYNQGKGNTPNTTLTLLEDDTMMTYATADYYALEPIYELMEEQYYEEGEIEPGMVIAYAADCGILMTEEDVFSYFCSLEY